VIRPDVDAVRRALIEALGSADLAAVEAGLRQAARSTQRAAPVGPLAQFRAAEELQSAASLRIREHLAASLDRRADGRAVLRSRADDLVIEPDDVTAVADLVRNGSGKAAELGLELSRRLLLAGVAVAE
jgi:bifunctional lysine-specific demethylase and histidyl-hydroxylase NO66